jgi:hypothetical protein
VDFDFFPFMMVTRSDSHRCRCPQRTSPSNEHGLLSTVLRILIRGPCRGDTGPRVITLASCPAATRGHTPPPRAGRRVERVRSAAPLRSRPTPPSRRHRQLRLNFEEHARRRRPPIPTLPVPNGQRLAGPHTPGSETATTDLRRLGSSILTGQTGGGGGIRTHEGLRPTHFRGLRPCDQRWSREHYPQLTGPERSP